MRAPKRRLIRECFSFFVLCSVVRVFGEASLQRSELSLTPPVPCTLRCTLCHSDDGDPPKAPIVALGTRTYLALMENEELVPGHCRIVPVQHYLSCLEIDEEEGWDEIKVRVGVENNISIASHSVKSGSSEADGFEVARYAHRIL